MEKNDQAVPFFRFRFFEVDPRSGELRKAGSRIKLQDQPFKVLLALLERPGEVVTREELRARIWPDDSFGAFDHGVNVAIAKLRSALGDSADNPRYVETLHRRGYRFVFPVTAAPGDLNAAGMSPPGTGEKSATQNEDHIAAVRGEADFLGPAHRQRGSGGRRLHWSRSLPPLQRFSRVRRYDPGVRLRRFVSAESEHHQGHQRWKRRLRWDFARRAIYGLCPA